MDEMIEIDNELLGKYINRVSGIDEKGDPKTTISYQFYELNTNDVNKERIYNTQGIVLKIYRNNYFTDIFTVDLIFRSPEDTGLKLFWGRLNQYLDAQNKESEKDWIFYINILEKASVSLDADAADELLTCNIINPLIFYLTRQIPDMKTSDEVVRGEMQGGNIIRMLVPAKLLTFDVVTNIDTSTIKGEVLRDESEMAMYD